VFVGVMVFTLLISYLWDIIRRVRLRSGLIAQVLYLIWIVGAWTDGTLESLHRPALAAVGTVLVCEWLTANSGVSRGQEYGAIAVSVAPSLTRRNIALW
jgi:hypothetical protein